MTLARVYNVDTNSATGITIGSTTPGTEFPIMLGAAPAGVEFNVSAIRVGTYSGSSASYPSNGTVTFRLRRVTGTPTTGVQAATATAAPVSQSTTAAASVWTYSTLTNATGTVPTMDNVVWEQTIPCTAGANWGEWFTPGFEINVGPGQQTSTLALTYEYGAAGTSSAVNLIAGLVISE